MNAFFLSKRPFWLETSFRALQWDAMSLDRAWDRVMPNARCASNVKFGSAGNDVGIHRSRQAR